MEDTDKFQILFDLAGGEDRDELSHVGYIKRAARLFIEDADRFKALIDALADWRGIKRFHKNVRAHAADLNDARPKIRISETDLGRMLDEAESALIASNANLYQINGRLVQLVHHNLAEDEPCTEEGYDVDPNAPLRRPQGALVLQDISSHRLLELMLDSARWFKFDKRAKPSVPNPDDPDRRGAWQPSKPSLEVAKHLEARGQWKQRVLRGSVEAPTLRRTGSILQTAGYDRRSQLYFDDGGTEFPTIEKTPSRADGIAALASLKNVIKDFPFIPDKDGDWGGPSAARSVALSAMLTGLVRRSIATAPAHAIDAPVMGTGKTKIAEIASALVSGRTPTAISQGKTPEEFNKRLFATLLAGDPVIIIDNIEADIESDEFCSVLTSESVQNRILGLSRMATVGTNSLFVLNGNRMTFKGDITARVVICHLDARMEDPRVRTFDREPVEYTLANRPELVAAGLTALRAHAAAGFPGTEGLVPSRFPDWDRMVRAALIWLGEPDPQNTAEKVVAIDPVRDGHAALLRALRDTIGVGGLVTAQDIIDRASVDGEMEADQFTWPSNTVWPDEAAAELSDAISGALDDKHPTTKRLGRYLSKLDGRIADGLALRVVKDNGRSTQYRLQAVES